MTKCFIVNEMKNFVMIEYPGFVVNVDKAEDTLGGLSAMQTTINSEKDRLQLRFRVNDPLSHPAYGDRVPINSLLIKIKRKKIKAKIVTKSQSTEAQSLADENFTIELMGRIQTSFKFNSLAEFQWLPMIRINKSNQSQDDQTEPEFADNTKTHSKKVQNLSIRRTQESLKPQYKSVIADSLPLNNPFDNSVRTLNPECPLLVLPAVFSRFDTPRETVHQPPKFRSKEMREEFERQQGLAIIGRTRKKRATMSYRLNFNEKVPSEAPEKLIEERSNLSKEESVAFPKLKERFEKQKVWSKAALCYDIGCSSADIKYILPLVAFHYVTGPFRTMWVKYGYNPHKDKQSKLLQTLDFRIKSSGINAGGGTGGLDELNDSQYSRRSIHQYQLPLKRGVDKSKKPTQSINTEAVYIFREDLRPPARQMSYQLKDIEVEEIQAIIHSNDNCEPDECSERDGWLPEGTIDRIRKIMNNIMQKMFVNLSDTMLSYDIDPGSPLLVDDYQ